MCSIIYPQSIKFMILIRTAVDHKYLNSIVNRFDPCLLKVHLLNL
jgi:hypothetical protein